jgi:hypothetical protein
MQKINEKLITEINKLQDLIRARIEAEASRRGFGTIQGGLDNLQFILNPTYQKISKIKEQLSVPFQKKLDLKQIYEAKQAIHQNLTAPDYQTRARVDALYLSEHRPEDFQGNSRFLFKYFYSPLSGLFKFIDFVIFERLFNHYFSFRLTRFFFPNTIILEQFDKVIKGATLYNAHFDCLAKPKPKPKTNFFSKLPEDVLRNITHYLPAKDLEPIFLDRRLHASFKSVIEDYHSATNFLLKTSLKYNIEYIRFINPALLVHEKSLESLILMANHGFPAQLFETIHPRQLAQNFNSSVEELQRNGISKGVITGRSDPEYFDIYISIFNHNDIENYTRCENKNFWKSIGNRSVSLRCLKNAPSLTHEEMAKIIHQAL